MISMMTSINGYNNQDNDDSCVHVDNQKSGDQ